MELNELFYQNYWWFLISLLGALLVFLLFVQGGQSLLAVMGKTETEKSMMPRPKTNGMFLSTAWGANGNLHSPPSSYSEERSSPRFLYFIRPVSAEPIGYGWPYCSALSYKPYHTNTVQRAGISSGKRPTTPFF